MTTVIAQVPPGLAKRIAATADRLGCSHADVAVMIALRLFTRAAAMNGRTDGRTDGRSKSRAHPRRV